MGVKELKLVKPDVISHNHPTLFADNKKSNYSRPLEPGSQVHPPKRHYTHKTWFQTFCNRFDKGMLESKVLDRNGACTRKTIEFVYNLLALPSGMSPLAVLK